MKPSDIGELEFLSSDGQYMYEQLLLGNITPDDPLVFSGAHSYTKADLLFLHRVVASLKGDAAGLLRALEQIVDADVNPLLTEASRAELIVMTNSDMANDILAQHVDCTGSAVDEISSLSKFWARQAQITVWVMRFIADGRMLDEGQLQSVMAYLSGVDEWAASASATRALLSKGSDCER